MEGRIAILISDKNYLCFINSFFNKSTTKQVRVFIFLFEISTSAFSLNLDELDRPYQMKHLHIDRTTHESRLHVVLYYLIICFTLPCVLQITDTQKYNVVAPHYIFFL